MLYRWHDLRSRSASAENPTAAPGAGGTASNGLKGAPALKDFKNQSTEVLLDTAGPGMIRHIWMTPHLHDKSQVRNLIVRMYWEGSETPAVEAPMGDFFGVAHGALVPMVSSLVALQEGRGFNSWIPMPFARHARITITNETGRDLDWFFYQIDFTLGDSVTDQDGRFHARFRRQNPCPMGEDFTILETAGAPGIYLGCVFGVRPLTAGWWGEGEVKLYLDDDTELPTICGTGTEDYIGSAWGLSEHCTPYQGVALHRDDFTSMYRFHVPDPVYFRNRIRVTLQQMGAGREGELREQLGDALIFSPKNHPRRPDDDGFYLRSDDWCATAYWYQFPLAENQPPLPDVTLRATDLYTPQKAQREADL